MLSACSARTWQLRAHVSRRLLVFVGVVLSLLFWLRGGNTSTAPRPSVIISVASTASRAERELPIALETLLRQLTHLDELHVWLPSKDEEVIQQRGKHGRLPALLYHPIIRVRYVPDLGPAAKYVYILEDLVRRARNGEAHLMDQPVIVCDDDHAYSRHLISTLLDAHKGMPDVAVGLRGWRVREDLLWGVPYRYAGHHIQHGADLAAKYRVSVLTANQGYLLVPRFIFSKDEWRVAEQMLFNRTELASTPAHLVDDIVMSALLSHAGVERYVVPLRPFYAQASVDLSIMHTLEAHMKEAGTTRREANNDALRLFVPVWRREALWYDFNGPHPPYVNFFVWLWRRTQSMYAWKRWRATL